MEQTMLLYPIFAMSLLGLTVSAVLFRRRVVAIREGLNPGYFKFNHGAKLPAQLKATEQHYENIFDMPQLFYVAMLLAYVAVKPEVLLVSLAWGYVLVRCLHSYIHLGKNNVIWRRNAFVGSYVLLVLVWGDLFYRIVVGG